MNLHNVTKLKIQFIINNNLFDRNIIDEKTYSIVNEKLLKLIYKCNN